MAFFFTKVRAVIAPMAFLAAATACTTVFETGGLNQTAGIACQSSAGAYYLPKVLVRLNVVANGSTLRGFKLNSDPAFSYVADRRHQPYCLDYLASPTSKDVIAVDRDTNGLLQNVVSNLEDRSKQIAVNLIDTASFLAQAALRARTIDAAGTGESADLMFDPFDPEEMTEVNRALRRFGFCVYIENHSFWEEQISPQAWCSDPAQERYVNQYNLMLAITPVASGAWNTGILYRPNATHKLVIRRKTDPGGREPWALFMTKHMEMPNVSPIFSIGVSRALFATRNTDLTFAKGVLTNIKISKTSELESFSEIPLHLAQAIVALPTQIVQLRIDDTRGATSLADQQAKLITALAALDQTRLNNPNVAGAAAVAGVPDRQAQLMQACLDQGGLPGFCRDRVIGPSQ